MAKPAQEKNQFKSIEKASQKLAAKNKKTADEATNLLSTLQTEERAEATSKIYLEHAKLTNFGRFANTIVGPFKPGLNVVYGPNEAGKTTINELIKGVLFGWPRSLKGANSYTPEASERVGSLFFKDVVSGEVAEVKRVRNTDELEDDFGVLGDIDKETFNTIFALTSDELTRLDRHSDITAHLLTAGSGTSASPAHALEEIEARIKKVMTKSATVPDSIPNLKRQLEEVRAQMHKDQQQTDHYLAREKQLHALDQRKETLRETQHSLNQQIETLKAELAKLEAIDISIANNNRKLEETIQAEKMTAEDFWSDYDSELEQLAHMTQKEEFKIRGTIEDFEETRLKKEHVMENARRDAQKSRVEYDSLMENRDAQEEQKRARTTRLVRLGTSVVIALAMFFLAALVLSEALSNSRLSYLVIGVALALAGLVIAAVGVGMSLRPSKAEEALDEHRKKAEWVMKQDQRAFELTEQDLHEHDQRIRLYLDTNMLSAAQGSLRRARYVLDHAREVRLNEDQIKQNQKALALQRASLESALKHDEKRRAEMCRELGLAPVATAEDVQVRIANKVDERNQTIDLTSETNRQYGEISQELQYAQTQVDFDEVKQKNEILQAQLDEKYHELATLFIAQRSLNAAIAEWERKSQPEVYRLASRLFSDMTRGAWQQVRMNAAGEIEVLDAVRTVRAPWLLSLGTQQQLYLSLRIALLITATNVGRSMPVLCDDILVNFDEARRGAAARALAELAQYRQVVVFTCHADVVSTLRQTNPSVNLYEL